MKRVLVDDGEYAGKPCLSCTDEFRIGDDVIVTRDGPMHSYCWDEILREQANCDDEAHLRAAGAL